MTRKLSSLLLQKLLRVKAIDHIYISTNHRDLSIPSDTKITLIDRDEHYCNNVTSWSDVIYDVVSSIPEDDDSIIMWCHTTTPLFDEHEKALTTFTGLDETKFNSLIVVEKLKEFINEVETRMTKNNCLSVPLEIDIGYGNNWDEAH